MKVKNSLILLLLISQSCLPDYKYSHQSGFNITFPYKPIKFEEEHDGYRTTRIQGSSFELGLTINEVTEDFPIKRDSSEYSSMIDELIKTLSSESYVLGFRNDTIFKSKLASKLVFKDREENLIEKWLIIWLDEFVISVRGAHLPNNETGKRYVRNYFSSIEIIG